MINSNRLTLKSVNYCYKIYIFKTRTHNVTTTKLQFAKIRI